MQSRRHIRFTTILQYPVYNSEFVTPYSTVALRGTVEMGFGHFVYIYIILAVVSQKALGITSTRKLCMEFRICHSHRNADFLGVTHHKCESGCLRQCGRLRDCSAYNYLQNGTCQLLPRPDNCHAPEELKGSSYVHLADCNGDLAWQVDHPYMNANKQCLTWHRPLRDSATCPSEMLREPDNTFCAGVVASKGLYLPGWYVNGKFRVISAKGTNIWCENGYFLRVSPNCSSTWQDYTAGDPIPGQAVPVSVWKDGTPLFMVAARFMRGWRTGYYLTTVKRTFLLIKDFKSPTNVKILIVQ